MTVPDYKLSAEIYGHTSDVRGVSSTHNECIVSCSRDKSAKLWTLDGFENGYVESQVFRGHKNYISCICTLPPSPEFINGLILTGGNDCCILCFEPNSSEPVIEVKAHENTVCKLARGWRNDGPVVLSASWDKTCKIWKVMENNLECVVTLSGHDAAVWCIAYLTCGFFVTGSADKNIIAYDADGVVIKTLRGHSDCVRDVIAVGHEEIISCSNDATIKRWNVKNGECIETLSGHTNYIYSVDVLEQDNMIASCGEDSILNVWFKNSKQSIFLPVQSVWTVAILPNADIVTGSSDGVIRIFTADKSRQANKETLAAYEEKVQNRLLNTQKEIGGIKISDLPGPSALYEPGNTDGQTKMIKEGEVVVCYAWSATEFKWNKIGDVLGGTGGTQQTSGRVLHEGMEYDYVFNIDVESGKPHLKLPYNNSEDPWLSAQAFIHKHNLPQEYLEQVANFIITNSNHQQFSLNSSSEYVDPYTGAGRYIPGSSNPSVAGPSGAKQPPVGNKYFPLKSCLRFDQANPEKILEKLIEFNEKSKFTKFSSSDLEKIVKLTDLTNDGSEPNVLDKLKLLLQWPADILFPALDVLRLAVRNEKINTALCANNELFNFIKGNLSTNAPVINQMLTLKVLCNMFCHKLGEQLVCRHKDFMFDCLPQHNYEALKNKSFQIAVSTLVLNFVTTFYRRNDKESLSVLLFSLITIFPQITEEEAILRCLMGLGTILIHSPELKDIFTSESKENFEVKVIQGSERIKECAKYIYQI